MALVLYCRECKQGYRWQIKQVGERLPDVCPMCNQETTWTGATIDEPSAKYDFTDADEAFLTVVANWQGKVER